MAQNNTNDTVVQEEQTSSTSQGSAETPLGEVPAWVNVPGPWSLVGDRPRGSIFPSSIFGRRSRSAIALLSRHDQ